MEEIGDKRLYIKREKDRERECVCACVLFYNTKLWTQFYICCLTSEQGWLRSVCASSQYDQTLLFFAYHLRWGYIPKTHTVLEKIQKKKKKKYPATSCGGYYNAEISLYIKLYPSVSNIYSALKYKNTVSRTRLNLSLFQNLWFFTSKERITEFVPFDCHSLFESQSVGC